MSEELDRRDALPVNLEEIDDATPPKVSGGRKFPFVAWTCALSPFVLLLVFLAMAIHVRLGLGHWPEPMMEDYKSPAFSAHEVVLTDCVIFAVYVSGPLWLVCLLFPRLRPVWPRITLCQAGVWVFCWLLNFAVLKFDPTTFSDWFLD